MGAPRGSNPLTRVSGRFPISADERIWSGMAPVTSQWSDRTIVVAPAQVGVTPDADTRPAIAMSMVGCMVLPPD